MEKLKRQMLTLVALLLTTVAQAEFKNLKVTVTVEEVGALFVAIQGQIEEIGELTDVGEYLGDYLTKIAVEQLGAPVHNYGKGHNHEKALALHLFKCGLHIHFFARIIRGHISTPITLFSSILL